MTNQIKISGFRAGFPSSTRGRCPSAAGAVHEALSHQVRRPHSLCRDQTQARLTAMAFDGPLFPVGLVVRGRRCLVVGGGPVAARKAISLLHAGAAVTLVAPEVHEALGVIARSGALEVIDEHPLDVQLRPYERGEAAAYRLVITATGLPAVDAAVFADAEAAGVWVNSADDPAHCTAVLPAVWRSGPVSVAVSTEGASPALAGWLRDRVGTAVGDHAGALAALLGRARASVRESGRSTESIDWRGLLDGELPSLVAAGRVHEAAALLARAVGVPDAALSDTEQGSSDT